MENTTTLRSYKNIPTSCVMIIGTHLLPDSKVFLFGESLALNI